MTKQLKIMLALFAVSILVFVVFPGIDLWSSSLFYKPASGFYLENNPLVQISYRYNRHITIVTVSVVVALLLATFIRNKPVFNLNKKAYAYLLLVMLVGHYVVVNIIFKDGWGRARPVSIEQFGGDRIFTPAFVISDQCERNCSFVSGHSATLFYFVALGLLLSGRKKWLIISVSIALGTLVGLGRIMQGGHFLSDIVFSFYAIMFTALALYYFMFGRGVLPK